MRYDHEVGHYAGRRVTVAGLGLFGGGVAVARYLAQRGASVTITDQRSREVLAPSIEQLADLPIEWQFGPHEVAAFCETDLLVVNPAFPPNHPLVQAAARQGVAMTSEMNLFWQLCPARIVGVTGSNGKSTTTAMTAQMLRCAGQRVWLGGNVGKSLLPVVHEMLPSDVVVLELSSFMLHDLDRLQVSPHVAVVTNFAPNHLDWHPDLNHYRWSKQTILRHQGPGDVAVLNADDADVWQWESHGRSVLVGAQAGACPRAADFRLLLDDAPDSGCELVQGDRRLMWPLERAMRLPGRHNLMNALMASAASVALLGGNPADHWPAIKQGVMTYAPLPHRLEPLGTFHGRTFYNDSLATTPESTIVALQAFAGNTVLLAGGYDKRADLAQLGYEISRGARVVALMGQTGPVLDGLIQAAGDERGSLEQQSPRKLTKCHMTFREAVAWAIEQSQPGETVLLSPGCASYDWFKNFADRGEQFRQLVVRYGSAPTHATGVAAIRAAE